MRLSMPRGELTVIQAFYEKELEERNELIRKADGKVLYSVDLGI